MFTQPAFIRKNTPELRKKLENLGYKCSKIVFEHPYLCIATVTNNECSKEDRIRIDRDLFPEITYYNSPKEVVLQIKEDLNTNI